MATPKSSESWKVIGRGFNGWHACGHNTRSSGGELEPGRYPFGGEHGGYLAEAAEGALVYDAQHLEWIPESSGAFIELVISGPMVDVDLPSFGERRFGEDLQDIARRLLPGLEGDFRTLASMAATGKYGGLDRVGVGIFEELLRRVPGIKIGHVRSGRVEWNGPSDSMVLAAANAARLEAVQSEEAS